MPMIYYLLALLKCAQLTADMQSKKIKDGWIKCYFINPIFLATNVLITASSISEAILSNTLLMDF